MRYLSTLLATSIALPFFPPTTAISKPKPKPPPSPAIPLINATTISSTPHYIPNSNTISPSSTSDSGLFGSDLSSSEILTAISSESTISLYQTNDNHEWKEIQTLQYSPKETISSISVCDSTVAVGITENLCDDNLVDCQIYNPQINFITLGNGKISGIQSYGGSYLHDMLAPDMSSSSYYLLSLNIVCSRDAVIVTSAWKNQNSSTETTYGTAIGTKFSSSLSSAQSRSSSSYFFEKLDTSEFLSPTDPLSVSIYGENILIGSLTTTTSSSLSPVAHFFSFNQLATSTNYTTKSSPISFVCSVYGNSVTNYPGSSSGITTALKENYAILGLSQFSEVYVYTLSNQTTGSSSCSWKSVGILRASDSYDGDLFGYSVHISSSNIIVGAPHAIAYDGTQTGAVYLYKFNSTSRLWYEEKVLVEKNQLAADTTTNSALGSRVYATDSALFFCDVPRSVNAHLGEEAENSLADVEGKVYVIWADTSGYEEKDSTNDTVWTATVLWALVLVSIPVAVAFALIGYRYRDSFCGAHKSLTDSTGTPSSSTHPSPFLLTSCVESTNTENQGASIIKASPLTHHVFRSQTTKKGNDVESNCSSPAGQETKTSWKFSEMVRGRSNYQQLQVPDSPSCRSEVSTVSITSGSASDPSRADGNWFERLFGWRLVSSEPSTLPSASGRNSDELTDSTLPRSSLQSPAPPLSRSSNPMVSPAVVE